MPAGWVSLTTAYSSAPLCDLVAATTSRVWSYTNSAPFLVDCLLKSANWALFWFDLIWAFVAPFIPPYLHSRSDGGGNNDLGRLSRTLLPFSSGCFFICIGSRFGGRVQFAVASTILSNSSSQHRACESDMVVNLDNFCHFAMYSICSQREQNLVFGLLVLLALSTCACLSFLALHRPAPFLKCSSQSNFSTMILRRPSVSPAYLAGSKSLSSGTLLKATIGAVFHNSVSWAQCFTFITVCTFPSTFAWE